MSWDLIKVKINATGTITAGTANTSVKYDSYIGGLDGLKTTQSVSAEVINCNFQHIGNGIEARFSPGVYNSTSDEWEIECSNMEDSKQIKVAKLWR